MDKQPAAYCRYSTDAQNATSIADQLRRCRSLAAYEGQVIDDSRVYTDEAISGKGGIAQRPGYHKLLDAWKANVISVLYVDELSRLTRDEAEGAQLLRRVENGRVIVVTGDGIDTRRRGWQAAWMLKLTMAGEDLRNTSERVSRTMEGCLERGWMIAAPPFGYAIDWSLGRPGDGHPGGARWVIDPQKAELVRELFRRRASGESVYALARWLNEQGIPTPRLGRNKQPSFWRGATIARILANRIYKGVFVYQGSAYMRAKLKNKWQEPKLTPYRREAFRLVSDDLWDRCNPRPGERRLRGGRRHVLAGLVMCGDCDSIISISKSRTAESMHCPSCEQAHRVGARNRWMGYTSVSAALQALRVALQELLNGSAIDELRHRLRERLKAGPGDEEARLKAQAQQLNTARQRLLQLGRNEAIGLEAVEEELAKVQGEFVEVKERLRSLEKARTSVSPAAVAKQIAVPLGPLLDRMLSGEPSPHEVRATLGRLVSRFAFVARPNRGVSVFEVRFVPGAFVAEQVNGALLDNKEVILKYRVCTTARRPTVWTIERL